MRLGKGHLLFPHSLLFFFFGSKCGIELLLFPSRGERKFLARIFFFFGSWDCIPRAMPIPSANTADLLLPAIRF